MKKLFLIWILFLSAIVFSQSPHLINYQAIARDAAGNIISSGSIGLKFEILQGSSSGPVVYGETNIVTPSSAGIFNVAIGAGTATTGTLSAIAWGSGPYFIKVSVDPTGGTSYNVVGNSQLVSVPYALYAEKAGSSSGSLPTGTVTGQTLYWDQSATTWVPNSNLFNNGSNVNVGEPFFSNNKMKVVSKSNTDSAALYVYKPNSIANQAAIRGFASGNANNSGSLTINPIIGGHFIGYNLSSTGSAVGAVAQGISPNGDAVGLIGVASSSASSVGRSVGLYASSTGPYYPTSFAAIFDRGKVFMNDTLIYNVSGSTGDVLIRGNNGKAYWGAPAGAGPWTQSVNTVTLTNANDNVVIGSAGISSKLNVGTPSTFSGNDISIASNSTTDALQIFKLSGGGSALRLVNGAATTNTSIASIAMISGNNPVGLDINISSNSPALQAQTTGSTAAILGINSTGGGQSIRGTKNNTGSGIAGQFDINNPSNSADALFAYTLGSGAAVHAMTGTTTTSALSLLVENGHIKVVGPSLSVSSTTVVGGFSAITGATCISCNDVRGIVSFSTGVTGFGSPNYADVTINFSKPYNIIPNISLTPLVDMQDLGYVVSNATTTSFTIRVYRSSNKSVPLSVPTAVFKFNYLVIE